MSAVETFAPADFKTADAPTDTAYLTVENVSCAGCIRKIETALLAMQGVEAARINLSTRRIRVSFDGQQIKPVQISDAVTELGYPAAVFNPAGHQAANARATGDLLKAMAVAGFAAANVMLLSVSVWSGHASGMGDGTRTLFHWISALIAIPAIAYAGRPFFNSAIGALSTRRLNMDVPISLAVLLAAGMSIQQTMQSAEHAYFDAAISLLFFLLIGRYLDQQARTKARSAAEHLLSLRQGTATVIDGSGAQTRVAAADLRPDMILHVAAGERLAADGFIDDGQSEFDMSLVTGESLPQPLRKGDRLFAGTVNVGQPITVRVAAAGEDTLLAEIVRLMEAAEQGHAKYIRIADRLAQYYAPAIHILAAATFIGWMVVTAGSWEQSLLAAIAVLIITCPCALGLAVPVVQVVASGMLLRRGILLKSPDGLERLAEIDTIVFDKTGTLTKGALVLENAGFLPAEDLAMAAGLAQYSRHPLSQAIKAACPDAPKTIGNPREMPGQGLEGFVGTTQIRLGQRTWCNVPDDTPASHWRGPALWLAIGDAHFTEFRFTDDIRPDAAAVVDNLRHLGLQIELLSGDREGAVQAVAGSVGIDAYQAQVTPDEKAARLSQLAAEGRKVLMVGDGLNDAPALAAGHASMSPATAADISQTAADFVFQGDNLQPVLDALTIARGSMRHVKQNFGLSLLYNMIAVPIAVTGLATPLVAAIAMSSSSILVTLNALRLRWGR